MSLSLVKQVLDKGHFYTPHEIQVELMIRHKLMISDASVTARIRDLKKPQFGRHTVLKRLRDGRRSYEYQLVKTEVA